MTTIILFLSFLFVIGLRMFAAKKYADNFDALPEEHQQAIVRKMMLRSH